MFGLKRAKPIREGTNLFLFLCVQNDVSTTKPTELRSWWGHILPTAEAHGPETAKTEGCCYTAYCESLVQLCVYFSFFPYTSHTS